MLARSSPRSCWVCARWTKSSPLTQARSKPMSEIVKRLLEYGDFEVNIFGDDTILCETVDDWPNCDCLFAWHSEGFPIKKAALYAAERKPFFINDLSKQHLLLDRRRVYGILKEAGIPVPNHVIVSRDSLDGTEPEGLVEKEDYIEFQGQKIRKPFVEKPASGEDHNIYIYYPAHMGGGVKKLYRKINNKSADYELNHPGTIRRNGSFIYEEFLATGGTDVKVYTVGTRYAHAEARKSPVVDGKVQRTKQGKEVRFPVLLSPQEKEIARMVTIAFGQKVCGFDLLRSDKGRSYVCDVNGWSFVKSSYKYYDDAAGILRSTILTALAPHRLTMDPSRFPSLLRQQASTVADQMRMSVSYNDIPQAVYQDVDGHVEEDPRYQWEELRCVLAVIRHGDRTPKQKMKIKVTQAPILELFEKHKDKKGKEAKLKSPKQLQELLDITRRMVQEMPSYSSDDAIGVGEIERGYETRGSEVLVPELSELREKFQILINVLEAGGHFAGINRKVQLKPLVWSSPRGPQSQRKVEEVLLILKHGGVLTHAGRQQSEDLGKYFRTAMYPSNGAGELENGLLRLHSTYRHDLKIYSSDEGRVQASAAAFTKGLLDLEGSSLTPILASLVKKETGMLDACDKAADDIQMAKLALYEQLTRDTDSRTASFARPPAASPRPSPPRSPSIAVAGGGDSVSPESLHLAQSMELLQEGTSGEALDSHTNEPPAATGRAPDTARDRPAPAKGDIQGLPQGALRLLYRLVDLLQDLVDQLYQKCKMEGCMTRGSAVYSSLSQDPSAWVHEPNKPCCGERPLLLYDRWRKLSRSFYKRTKDSFDISKVPDIYDSVKYDAIHNQHLDLKLEELYETARALALGVVPNEYGVSPEGKLQIGSQISSLLLGKLLADLGNTREESKATANLFFNPKTANRGAFDAELGAYGFEDYPPMNLPNIGSKATKDDAGSEEDNEGGEESDSTLHRLCPSYAVNINSPMRHVRTRVYFTSESHIHALVNVLRYCHIGVEGAEPLMCESGQNILNHMPELDYLSHIVFRMYENQKVHITDPLRFRVEVLFSPGAAYNPFEVMPLRRNHTLPVHPRVELHQAEGATLDSVERLVARFSTPRKLQIPALDWLPASSSGKHPTFMQWSALRKPSLSTEQPTGLSSE